MSLVQMGKSGESVRFLDDFDLTFTMDNGRAEGDQIMNIEISAKPVVVRASYRDINLIMVIVNRAIALSTRPEEPKPKETSDSKLAARSAKSVANSRKPGIAVSDEARVIMTKEQVGLNVLAYVPRSSHRLSAQSNFRRIPSCAHCRHSRATSTASSSQTICHQGKGLVRRGTEQDKFRVTMPYLSH